MKVIPREAGRITYSTEIRNLKKIRFNEYQREVIIGCILGDGCLCENWSGTNYRLLVRQGIAQKEYLLWKYSILKNWVLSESRYHTLTRSLMFRTISHPELTELRKIFYPENKKSVPINITELIRSPITLAVWFMDDGDILKTNKHIHGYHLNTQSFSKDENELLARALKIVHGIECTIQKNNGYVRLFIRAQSREKFVSIIKEIVIPSMQYKLG